MTIGELATRLAGLSAEDHECPAVINVRGTLFEVRGIAREYAIDHIGPVVVIELHALEGIADDLVMPRKEVPFVITTRADRTQPAAS